MLSKLAANYLALAAFSGCLSGCDTLVSTAYRGESRLSLAMRVENSATSNTDSVVPALASLDEVTLRFRAAETRGSFPADFHMDVFDLPDDERTAPLNPWLAPDIIVSQEYVAAVVEQRLEDPVQLVSKRAPIAPDCWNGSCDRQPLPKSAPEYCEDNDRACRERQRVCPNGRCATRHQRADLPEGLEDMLGFAQEHRLLFVQAPVPAGSWAALRLGSADGLEPGYHLGKVHWLSSEEDLAFDLCISKARSESLERFNAEHGTAYTDSIYLCLESSTIPCDHEDLPTGKSARELARATAAAEVDKGCHEIAPEFVPIAEPSKEKITVRMGKGPPIWAPSIPLWRTQISGLAP